MTFVDLVRDNQENVVIVYLREEVTPANKLFIMSGDTFNEMVDLSREFEQSLSEVTTVDREDKLNSSDPKDTLSDQENDNQEEQHIFFRERRNRSGRANRYQDLLVHLEYC